MIHSFIQYKRVCSNCNCQGSTLGLGRHVIQKCVLFEIRPFTMCVPVSSHIFTHTEWWCRLGVHVCEVSSNKGEAAAHTGTCMILHVFSPLSLERFLLSYSFVDLIRWSCRALWNNLQWSARGEREGGGGMGEHVFEVEHIHALAR